MGNSGSSSAAMTVMGVAGAAAAAVAAWSFASWTEAQPPWGPSPLPQQFPEESKDEHTLPDLSFYNVAEVAVVDEDGDEQEPSVAAGHGVSGTKSGLIKIMSYNVWSLEHVKIRKRMKTISQIIQKHCPEIILLQEVTPLIYKIFQNCKWWGQYECSVPPEKATKNFFCMMLSKLPVKKFYHEYFKTTTTGKRVCIARIETEENKKLVVATCHLKKSNGTQCTERASQAKEALCILKSEANVVLGGDMNWDEVTDGPFPLPRKWNDAWLSLRPKENGYTYDTKSNMMMRHSRVVQRRLDRFVCKLKDFMMVDIDIIGTEAITGASYTSKGEKLPVYPSDHYGLLLTISCKS